MRGRKSDREKFAGAMHTYTIEAMMRDTKALQSGTSHNLGQNFAKASGIRFLSRTNTQEYAWTTSWGVSTRLIGTLIMAHGDEHGLVVPPRLAPIQVVVVPVRDEPEVMSAVHRIADELRHAGIRVRVDQGRGSFGRRVTDWEIKGIPVRCEVGPRDLADGLVTIARRDNGEKSAVPLDAVVTSIQATLDAQQTFILERAEDFLRERTVDVSTVQDASAAAKEGFARVSFDVLRGEGEAKLRTEAITVRCLQRADGSMPDNEDEPGLIAIVGRSY